MEGLKRQFWFYTFFFAIIIVPYSGIAQNEAARENFSLKGLQGVHFTITVEKNNSFETIPKQLQVKFLQKKGEKLLSKNGITVYDDKDIPASDLVPFLYMHLNMMNLKNEMIPFSVSLYLYQPVKLELSNDIRSSAITWESSTLGITSKGNYEYVNMAFRNLLNEFIGDFFEVNDNR